MFDSMYLPIVTSIMLLFSLCSSLLITVIKKNKKISSLNKKINSVFEDTDLKTKQLSLVTEIDNIVVWTYDKKSGFEANGDIEKIVEHKIKNNISKREILLILKKFLTKEEFSSLTKSIAKLKKDKKGSIETVYKLYINDEIKWVSFKAVTKMKKDVLKTVGIIIDITSQKMCLEHMKEIAYIDSLTNSYNINYYYENADLHYNSVICININDFKGLNEIYGISCSDKILKEVAIRINSVLNSYENEYEYALFRFYGDLFFININLNNKEEAFSLGKNISKKVTTPIKIKDAEITIDTTTAIIEEVKNKKFENKEKIVNNIKLVLNYAKKNSEKIVVVTEEMQEKINKEVSVKRLLEIIDLDEVIEPYYQPKINIETGKIVGCEALARWSNNKYGMIYPDEFVPILEYNKKIYKLDMVVAKKSVIALKKWRSLGIVDDDFVISFNFSMLTWARDEIVEFIEMLHVKYEIPYNKMEIEVTETVFGESDKVIYDKIVYVSNLGVKISLDDFSVGHSSITRLNSLPLDTIKVDKGILPVEFNDKNREIFVLLHDFGENLNLKFVIEGVENKNQVDELLKIGFNVAQGYFYDKPLQEKTFIKKYFRFNDEINKIV